MTQFKNKCGKKLFYSKSEAKKWIKIFNSNHDRKLSYVYFCESCNSFHVTSQDKVKARVKRFHINKDQL